MKKINRKIRDGVIIAVSVIVVVLTAVLYSVFASKHIYNESNHHLTEIYEQVKNGFGQRIELNRKLLKSWEQYIDETVNDIKSDDKDKSDSRRAELESFLASQIKEFDFSACYFVGEEVTDNKVPDYAHKVKVKQITVDDDGNAVDGDPMDIRVRRSVYDLLESDTCGVVGFYDDGNDKTMPEFMMFAVKTTPNVIDGFAYNAIAVSFKTGDVSGLLAVSTFGKAGICYVTRPNGLILARSGGKSEVMGNYLDFLKSDECEITHTTAAQIERDWAEQKSGACIITRDGVEYYLTYLPIEFSDWMLLGLSPTVTVNSSMSWFRTVTLIVMISIFAFIIVIITVIIILNNRHRIHETLLESESRERLLNVLSMNTNDVFVMFSPDTFEAEYVSANTEKVLGVDPAAVRADIRTLLQCADAECRPFTTEGLKTLGNGNVWEKNLLLKNDRTGESYWFCLTLYHSKTSRGEKCILVFSDRTDDKTMREQLEQALELAKSANEAKSHFLSNMSHDIRTPMNAIIGYASLLAKDADDGERVREYTHKITYSGQHLLGLINDVLDMSKIESGKTSLYIERFCLPEFVEELYSMMLSQTNAKKQSFDVHINGTLPEFVMGDKMRLNQILLNILSNAVKYTPNSGKISLNVETLKQQVHNHAHIKFSVEDNGIGMSEDYVKTIFEPFSRETTTVTKSIQGTGLGMAITKNIVDLMGGVISVESKQGEGSKFNVELELAVADVEPDYEDFWLHHNVTRVLVVDDEEDVCIDIKEVMSDTGVIVDYKLSGKEAVRAVERAAARGQDYDVVIVDWKMPQMNGVETARRIRKSVGRKLTIMALTSFGFEEIEEEAKAAGIDWFLTKPFFVSNFRRAVMQINADAADSEVASAEEEISIDGLSVLAAEDNEINVEILTELLDIEGVHCDVAPNGRDALETFEASPVDKYDVIFMDIQMPIMDGYEATRLIRACSHPRAKTVPIIAMTANAFDDDVKAALESGMNAHLAKPIDMTKLKQLVAKFVQKKDW
ncbi:MAG: response regulator [Clostridiales bacterium]|nr:response regulator [Clostridiales bacterium]